MTWDFFKFKSHYGAKGNYPREASSSLKSQSSSNKQSLGWLRAVQGAELPPFSFKVLTVMRHLNAEFLHRRKMQKNAVFSWENWESLGMCIVSKEWGQPLLEDLVMTLRFMARTQFLKVLRHKEKFWFGRNMGSLWWRHKKTGMIRGTETEV